MKRKSVEIKRDNINTVGGREINLVEEFENVFCGASHLNSSYSGCRDWEDHNLGQS
jgi:hypothetical protein